MPLGKTMRAGLETLSIETFARSVRRRQISCAEVTEYCLEQIRVQDDRLKAFILVAADEARRRAREADRELAAGTDLGPLHGVPISVKDLIDMRGTATTAASRVREGHTAERDAPIITHLRAAGAVLIGKTNLHEFAFGTTSEDSAFGAVRNPHDAARSPGGSSGGSAVSVAAGMALATIGTDTGGSIRIPAAACGIVGLKPSLGEVSTAGVVPLSRTLDHVGPLARTVTDAWLVYRALVGDHAPDDLIARPARDLRLGILRRYFCDVLDVEVRGEFDNSMAALRSAGVHVTDVDLPHASSISAIYQHIQSPEASAYHATTLEKEPDRYSRAIRLRLELGRYILAEDRVRALNGREVLRREVDEALAGNDALVLPTLPIPAPIIGAESVVIDGATQPVRGLMLRCTQPFNITGHPAITIPSGHTSQGLPCAVQLVGRPGRTKELLETARTCETVLREAAARI